MSLKKLEQYILPKEIDFFGLLQEQSVLTKHIIDELYAIHMPSGTGDTEALTELMDKAEQRRTAHLKSLYQVFITPVDKEAIGRAVTNLDWVVMSVKHLQAELAVFKISNIADYTGIFDLLKQEIDCVHNGFKLLEADDRERALQNVADIIRLDNELIQEYARKLAEQLGKGDTGSIMVQHEILAQLKEVSKRIRMCAGDLEDILFKLG